MLLVVSWTVWESILFAINSFPFPASAFNVSWGGFDCGGGGGCLVAVGDLWPVGSAVAVVGVCVQLLPKWP
jgi:hypothetical protein